MKRSEINQAIVWAKQLIEKNNICLPEYAHWDLAQWKAHADKLETIKRVMLGWDITDFGTGDFSTVGAVLYTVRNGALDDASVGVPYCEKYILMKDGQRLPKHYHVMKTEDIINRANGVLQVFLWQVDPKTGEVTDDDVTIYMDGVPRTFKPGEEILIQPGKDLVVGEVSAINDDNTDNYFLEPTSRFADIVEDEPALHPLCNEYAQLIG